ncbi:extracellular solute-binding protein [Fundicoccus culcitae]|uniref:Extracellular solute-binding protein n=1 Tax=Fundicoccus culcitae TaxID=2969821 RepID=A0ABY5PAE3_9LACT|nr:extracellular solute-binding protein [Fundicoccus culcitae]UUX35383.1 extracellular solute-binding protein [Fundicoccus culcitae]
MRVFNAIKITMILVIVTILAASTMVTPLIVSAQINANTLPLYNAYLEEAMQNNVEIYDGESITIELAELDDISVDALQGEYLELDNLGELQFDFEAPEDGLYYFVLEYLDDKESILPTTVMMEVNGESQYQEMQNIAFSGLWSRVGDIVVDRYGNEIAPEVKKVVADQIGYLTARNGYYDHPFVIQLNRGSNTIKFTSTEGALKFKRIHLLNEAEIPSMNLASDSTQTPEGNANIIIQGESIVSQSDSSIRPAAAFNDALTPYNATSRVLNYLDGASFKQAGDTVTYHVDVPENGYYYISLHYQQDVKPDFPVYLNVTINGQYPSESFLNQQIPYSSSYQIYTMQHPETHQAVPVYLEAGTQEISLSITMSPLQNVMQRLEEMVLEIQGLSLNIENLLGANIDLRRDIDLDNYLPGIPEMILGWSSELEGMIETVKELGQTDVVPGAFQQLDIARKQLENLGNEPRRIPNRWNELAKGGSSVTAQLATLIQTSNNNGVSIDQIILHQAQAPRIDHLNFMQRAGNSVSRFLQTFGEQDYEVKVNSDNLQVWVNRPRQYIEIMQQMIDQSFTAQTGIAVDLSIMPDQNKLILANSAGNEPDVALGVGYAVPFDLAIRGALEELSSYEGYDEVVADYAPNLLIPASIGEESYALPETMNFYVLFYRRDVLESLALPVPETMEDVVNMLPALNQRGMNMFYPTATLGTAFKIFPWTMPLVYQSGGNFFTEDILRTGLATEETLSGVRDLTDLFTIYSMPVDVPSFYQQFRDGTIPIGISDYGNYNLLLNAAPEIANLWEIALTPGVENEDGVVERWTSGGAESSIMFSNSEMKDEAWEFLKWWHSAEIQVQFGNTLQTTFGQEYMWNTANLTAFEQLPWSTKHKQVILEQSEWIAEVPRVLGGYMIEREVSRLYTSVVVDGENLRRSADLSIKRINREILRKLEEFGYIQDGQWAEPYPLPEIDPAAAIREEDN